MYLLLSLVYKKKYIGLLVKKISFLYWFIVDVWNFAATTPNNTDDNSLECALLECLNGALPPVQSGQLSQTLSTKLRRTLEPKVIDNLLQKFAYKELIR